MASGQSFSVTCNAETGFNRAFTQALYAAGGMFITCLAVLFELVQVGLLCAVLLAINNLRDVATDALVGKNTLPVIFGVGFGKL